MMVLAVALRLVTVHLLWAPQISNVSPEINETITCTATATGDDGEIPTITYEWSDGQNVLGTGASLTLTSSMVSDGDVVICTATATDNFGGVAGSSIWRQWHLAWPVGWPPVIPIWIWVVGSRSIWCWFQQGSDPQGRYDLTNDFYLMTTEVTQGMFTALMSYDPTIFYDIWCWKWLSIILCDWHMAADFANMVTQQHNSVNGTSLQECYTCSNSETIGHLYGGSEPLSVQWICFANGGWVGICGTKWNPVWLLDTDGGGGYSSAICDGSARIQDGVTNPLLVDYAWYCGNNDNQYRRWFKRSRTRIPNALGSTICTATCLSGPLTGGMQFPSGCYRSILRFSRFKPCEAWWMTGD